MKRIASGTRIPEVLATIAAACFFAAGCKSNGGADRFSANFTSAIPMSSSVNGQEKQSLDIQLSLARTLEARGDTNGAETVYRQLMGRFPQVVYPVHGLAVLCDKQKRFGESERLFHRCLKLQPGNPDILCDLGYSQYLQRRWGDAEMNLKQALQWKENHKRSHNHLGALMCQTDRGKEALEHFLRAGCSQAEAHMNAGLILSLNGKLLEGRKEYQLAFSSNPTLPELRQRLMELDSILPDTQPATKAVVFQNTSPQPQSPRAIQTVEHRETVPEPRNPFIPKQERQSPSPIAFRPVEHRETDRKAQKPVAAQQERQSPIVFRPAEHREADSKPRNPVVLELEPLPIEDVGFEFPIMEEIGNETSGSDDVPYLENVIGTPPARSLKSINAAPSR